MGVSIAEQETSINIMRDSEYAEIYTSDSTMMTKYDKFAETRTARTGHARALYGIGKAIWLPKPTEQRNG